MTERSENQKIKEARELLTKNGFVPILKSRFDQLLETERERDVLDQLVNNPQYGDFWEAAKSEAAHQHQRWYKTDHIKPANGWLWTLVYLAAKAFFTADQSPHAKFFAWDVCKGACEDAYRKVRERGGLETVRGARKKQYHRIITVAAAAFQWAKLGDYGSGPLWELNQVDEQ